jgi:hypothetical protein
MPPAYVLSNKMRDELLHEVVDTPEPINEITAPLLESLRY